MHISKINVQLVFFDILFLIELLTQNKTNPTILKFGMDLSLCLPEAKSVIASVMKSPCPHGVLLFHNTYNYNMKKHPELIYSLTNKIK